MGILDFLVSKKRKIKGLGVDIVRIILYGGNSKLRDYFSEAEIPNNKLDELLNEICIYRLSIGLHLIDVANAKGKLTKEEIIQINEELAREFLSLMMRQRVDDRETQIQLWKSTGERTEFYRDYYHKDLQNIHKGRPPFFQSSAIAILQQVLSEHTANLLGTKLSEYLDPELALITGEMKALLESRNLY